MEVTGPGIAGAATVESIIDSTRYELSQSVALGEASFTYGPSLTMKLYYLSEPGFFVPGVG